MYLVIDFEGFSDRVQINKILGMNQNTIPCLLSYAVIDDIEKLNNPCKKIKSK
jgi:hypothetical protein